ncbi:MAG: DNA repair protein RecO [Gloeomargarita sp. SKYBB_i_bin120]|nr:DNA repair protein RecO [Gloeomargarita sp. SKYG98]MCS7291964.1 DNA repair protein RecO [Gloeomargarita sp. SKYB120]MDW8177524.1 DNA repair protein RecO [Gloeomargarita sp. SKYBB_i_bin120]
MGRTYQVTAINLQCQSLGEADRLLTILSPERGLQRVVAPGARKLSSPLAGLTGLLTVNRLELRVGRSLDRITQATLVQTHQHLAQDYTRWVVAQYLTELVLGQALANAAQGDLYQTFSALLAEVAHVPPEHPWEMLVRGLWRLLTIAGWQPQVRLCCLTGRPVEPGQRVGFSIPLGGLVRLPLPPDVPPCRILSPAQVEALQALADAPDAPLPTPAPWRSLEALLRPYAEYHLERPIRSASLLYSTITLVSATGS